MKHHQNDSWDGKSFIIYTIYNWVLAYFLREKLVAIAYISNKVAVLIKNMFPLSFFSLMIEVV